MGPAWDLCSLKSHRKPGWWRLHLKPQFHNQQDKTSSLQDGILKHPPKVPQVNCVHVFLNKARHRAIPDFREQERCGGGYLVSATNDFPIWLQGRNASLFCPSSWGAWWTTQLGRSYSFLLLLIFLLVYLLLKMKHQRVRFCLTRAFVHQCLCQSQGSELLKVCGNLEAFSTYLACLLKLQ